MLVPTLDCVGQNRRSARRTHPKVLPNPMHEGLTVTLFEMSDDPTEPVEKISAGRRRTMRQHDALAHGWHPLMGTKLRIDGETCGTCLHHCLQGGVAGNFHKCDLRNTGGPSTDIRVSWPGCMTWDSCT